MFLKDAAHGAHLRENALIRRIVNPLTGALLSEVRAPCDGWLFTIREYPLVDQGSLMARMLREESDHHEA